MKYVSKLEGVLNTIFLLETNNQINYQMRTWKSKYQILNQKDFEEIAGDSVYKSSYVRQVLRGNCGETKFNSSIYEKADGLLLRKINNIKKG